MKLTSARRNSPALPLLGLAGLGLLVLSLAVPGLAPAQISDSFDEVVEVNVVNVEVIVTDKDGNPVTGLTRDDFEIFEDKEPMRVSNFYEVRNGRNLSSPGPAGAGVGGEPGSAIVTSESRSFVIFVDNTSIQKQNRKRALKAARDFVNQHMRDTDFVKVAILAVGGSLETLQPFTNSPGDVVFALDKLEKAQTEGNAVQANHLQLIRDLMMTNTAAQTVGLDGSAASATIDPSRVAFEARMMKGKIDTEIRRLYHRTNNSLAAIEYLVRPLAGIPGQKAVVYFGEGLPIRPGESLLYAYHNKFATLAEFFSELTVDPPEIASLDFDLSDRFKRLVAKAQEGEVRFYAVDAAGKRKAIRGGAEFGMADSNTFATQGGRDVWNAQMDFTRSRNLRQGLELVANETGAATLQESRDFSDFFARIGRDLDNFYSLGYQPPHGRDGKFHQIDVRPKNKDYKVRHRQHYQNKTAEQRLVDLALAELLTERSSNPLQMQLVPGRAQPTKKKKHVLPLAVKFPVSKVVTLPGAGGDGKDGGRLTAIVVVRDASGNTSPPQKVPLTFAVASPEPGQLQVAVAEFRLLMAEGEQQLAVALRDDASGVTAAQSVSVTIDRQRR